MGSDPISDSVLDEGGSVIRGLAAMAALVIGLCAARPASAHPLDLGYMSIATQDDGVSVRLDIDANAAAILLGVDARALDSGFVHARADELARRSFGREPITTSTGTCGFGPASATLVGRNVTIASTAECPGAARRWNFPFVSAGVISPRFQLMVKQAVGGSELLTLVEHDQPTIDIVAGEGMTPSVGFGHFVMMGVEHIGAAPSEWKAADGGFQLPDGIDHILFLFALVLGGGSLRRLVGIATGFTLGHSITLVLAALDVVHVPASIVEPIIALSIAVAAAEAYSNRFDRHRWKIATAFGLVHGFGFAAALTHLELSARGKATALFGFNLGVEVGQVVIVLVAAPLIVALHRHPRVGRPMRRGAAAMIFVCGLYWFVQRAFG
jgi:hypothetical protein